MQNLLLFELTIPTWHLVLFLSIVGCLMLMNKLKLCLLVTYLFVFFLVFYLYRADLIAIAAGDRILLAAYHLFGFIIAVLTLYPFISPEQSAPARMVVGPEMSNLRKALLKRIDKMELVIKEGESKAMTEVRQSEEEKFDAEAKAALLKTQLEEKAEVLRRKEAALKELEENLNAQIQSLQDEVKQKDGLLAMHNGESNGSTSELEAKASALEAQLMDKEESLRARESDARHMEQSLNYKIQELENEQRQRDELWAMHNEESNGNTSELEAKASVLEAQLMDKEESLRARESDTRHMEQSLNCKIQELENEQRQRDDLWAMHNEESNGNTSELEAKASVLEAQLMDKEESLCARKLEAGQIKEILNSKIQELETELTQKEELLTHLQKDDAQRQATEAELEGLRAELHERNLILQAREMEVKMIKQSMPERVRELDKIVQRQPEKEPGKSRLGSFLAAIEKRN